MKSSSDFCSLGAITKGEGGQLPSTRYVETLWFSLENDLQMVRFILLGFSMIWSMRALIPAFVAQISP